MSELDKALRDLVDGAAEPVTLDEVRGRAVPIPDDDGTSDSSPRLHWLLAAAALVVVALVGTLVLILSDDAPQLDVGGSGEGGQSDGDPGEDAGQPDFELLELLDLGGAEPMGNLRAAVDELELAAMWSELGLTSQPPAVDFDRWVVVSITIPDDACPPALDGFGRDGEVWTPRFVELADMCGASLRPKTFVVAIDRAEVTPSFTLRLPADEIFDVDEQRLVVEVPERGTGPATTVPEEEVDGVDGETVAVVPLPPPGEARSYLLDDGFPIWVVHHADGSASAVPGVVPPDVAVSPEDTPLAQSPSDGEVASDEEIADMFWSALRWSPNGKFEGPITWDAWGRAVTAGRHRDLTDFTAAVDGDQVAVRRWTGERIPGSPVVPGSPSTGSTQPDLPPLSSSLDGLEAGWHQVDAAAVGEDGVLRLCPIDASGSFPLPTCPDSAPQIPAVRVPAAMTTWHFGPLLVRVNEAGDVDAVVPFGGMSSMANP